MRKLKERILSFVLAFVMVVSLFTGMTPTEVQAAVTQEPTEEELNCKLTTVDVTLEVGNEYIQCSELPEPTNSNYKWAYFYYPAPSDMDGYEEGVRGLIASTQESIGVATMSGCKAAHREEYGLLVKDVPSNGQIPVSEDGYGLLYIIQIYDYPIDVDKSGYRYYYNRVAMFDVSKEGTISNGLSGGGETPTPDFPALQEGLNIVDLGDDSIWLDENNYINYDMPNSANNGGTGDFYYEVIELPGSYYETYLSLYTTGIGNPVVDITQVDINNAEFNMQSMMECMRIYGTTAEGGTGLPISPEKSYEPIEEETVAILLKLSKDRKSKVYDEDVQNEYNPYMTGGRADVFAIYGVRIELLNPNEGGSSGGGENPPAESRTIVSLEDYVTIDGNNVTVNLGPNNTIPFGIANAPGTPKEILDGLVGETVADPSSPYVINYGWVLIPDSQRTAAYTFENLPSNTYYVYTYDPTINRNNETEAAVIGSYAFTIEEPTQTTYTITLDLVDIDDRSLNVECWGPDNNGYDNINTDGDTLVYTPGGRIKVSSTSSDDFEVTVQGANATIEEQVFMYGQYYYNVTDIDGDATLVVKPKTSGGGDTPTPPAHNHNMVTKYDENGHWTECSGSDCTEKTESVPHVDANADNKCDVCEYVLHTHSLTKVPATEATCTTDGNKEYYKCACGTLFKDAEGKNVTTLAEVKISAIGHDMTKATCTEPATCKRTGCTHTTDELGHDWSGEWTVIKEATATEEGKKETLCTRDCGQKKVIIIPKTGEVDESENLEKDAEVAPDSPIDEVTLNNTKEELLDSDIFTDKEKQDIKDGEDARVWLEVDKLDEDVIPSADKAKVEKEAEKIAGENATITYFDASLFKQIGNGKKTGIEKPGIDMKITIVIPKALLNDDDDMVREYKIIRLHKGEVDIITGEFNEETGEYSFETDRFSTYAIVYGDTPVVPEAPKTGDATNFMPILALLFAGLGMVVVGKKKRA